MKLLRKPRELPDFTDPFPRMVDILVPSRWGNTEISHFEVTPEQYEVERRSYEQLQPHHPGKWCQLTIGGDGWMYDVPWERYWNLKAVEHARGDVLIGGLGMGMILHPILAKPEVNSVTVLENNPNVQALVHPSLVDHQDYDKLTLEFADARQWDSRGRTFDAIWMDCIPWYSPHPEFFRLCREWIEKYKPHLRPGGWIDHWAYHECELEYCARLLGERECLYIHVLKTDPEERYELEGALSKIDNLRDISREQFEAFLPR